MEPDNKGRPEDCLAGGGEMGERMRSVDWSSTALGPVRSWPQSLRTAVSMMLESRFAMVVTWGRDHRFFYNDRYRPVLGDKHPAALGAPGVEIFPEIWSTLVGPAFDRVFQGEAFANEDWLLPLHRSGYLENCYFTVSYSPIRDETGGIGGVLAVVAETTGRVEGERRLATLRDLARRAADAKTPEDACVNAVDVFAQNPIDVPFAGLYLLDDAGSAAQLVCQVGVPPAYPLVPLQVPRDRHADDAATRLLAKVIETGSTTVVEKLPRRFGPVPGGPYPEPVTDALLIPLSRPGLAHPYGVLVAGVSPRRALDERYRGFFDLAADHIATGLQNAHSHEQERQRAEALAQLDRAKTAFFSNVSHEFRTPLTLMLGPLEDLLSGGGAEVDPAGREQITVVHRNAQRLLKLVNSLLDFARIEAGRAEASFQLVDLAEVTTELAGMFRSAVERAGVRFTVDCPELPESVYVDPDMWEKIVLNLLSNALKFTFAGEITVRLRSAGRTVTLEVSDTGAGIPAEEQDKVFNRFYRGRETRSRTHEGSGIGLALVQELVRLHGGSVSLQSEPGQGSTFSVTLPLGKDHLPPERIAASRTVASTAIGAAPFVDEAMRWVGGGEEPAATLPAPDAGAQLFRVLVADDNADMREYLQRILGRWWTVDLAANGSAALELARRNPPDIILTDVMMPELDGFGLLRAVRNDPRLHSVPVIMLSARAGEESRVEGLTAGADGYLVKPFSARELVARIGGQLATVRARREIERLREKAEVANRAKDEFLAMLGHELRNPLAPIVTSLQVMRLRPGSEVVEHDRALIERQVRHLTRLVDDLLDISRITSGKIRLDQQPLEISGAIAKAIEIVAPLIEERGQRLQVEMPAEGFNVSGDEQRLAQVFANILTNAAKYSDPGSAIEVTARGTDETVEVSVRDQGIGIAAEQLPNVFDLFVQGGAREHAQGGLGLGLAIVRNLVKLHGGKVTAASKGPGRGSVFTVSLPRERRSSRTPHPPVPTPVGSAPAQRGRSILVVDDNDDAADTLAAALQLAGYETRAVYDAAEALRVVDTFRPFAAILDIGLPGMTGYELAEQLRARESTATTRLVALSGYTQELALRRSGKHSREVFDAYVVKPASVNEILQILNQFATLTPVSPRTSTLT